MEISSAQKKAEAQAAFLQGDKSASVAAHSAKVVGHEEGEGGANAMIKPMVFGGLDGISTTFAVLAGSVGADLNPTHVLAMGMATLAAGAFSMGVGEYLSTSAERKVALWEMQREHWEVDNNPAGEVEEMVQIYMSKGIVEEDARTVANTLSKYKDFWVDHMMLHEIGMLPPDEEDDSFKGAAVMFLAFSMFGAVPLLSYWLFAVCFVGFPSYMGELVASVASFLTLFALGAGKSALTEGQWCMGGLLMAAQGSAAGLLSFGIGYVLTGGQAVAG